MLLHLLILILINFLITYYLNSLVLIPNNITNNLTKFYISLFIGLQMAFIEAILLFIYELGDRSFTTVGLITIIGIIMILVGYNIKLFTFMDGKQFLLTTLEYNESDIAMAETVLDDKDSDVRSLANRVIETRISEEEKIFQLLKKYE